MINTPSFHLDTVFTTVFDKQGSLSAMIVCKELITKDSFKNLEKISILTVKKNLGSQKIIAVGLNYLKKIKENFFITVMDRDGEDNPVEIEKMLELALKNVDHVITCNRKGRNDSLLIRFLYKLHLLITFFFSFKWISFGNFTTFNSKNIERILSDTSSWLAYSSSVIKNCKIKRVYARRDKRYFDKSKLSLLKLAEHSIRVNAVFAKRVLISSVVYISFVYFIFGLENLTFLISLGIIFFNLLIFLIRRLIILSKLPIFISISFSDNLLIYSL